MFSTLFSSYIFIYSYFPLFVSCCRVGVFGNAYLNIYECLIYRVNIKLHLLMDRFIIPYLAVTIQIFIKGGPYNILVQAVAYETFVFCNSFQTRVHQQAIKYTIFSTTAGFTNCCHWDTLPTLPPEKISYVTEYPPLDFHIYSMFSN